MIIARQQVANKLFSPKLANPLIAAAAIAVIFIFARILFVIILMIVFGVPKGFGLQNGHSNGRFEGLGLLDFNLGRFSRYNLVRTGIDHGDISMAAVAKLAAIIGRVNMVPVIIQYLIIRYHGWVKSDLGRFDMAAMIAVGRVLQIPARIAGDGTDHAVKMFKI